MPNQLAKHCIAEPSILTMMMIATHLIPIMFMTNVVSILILVIIIIIIEV